MTSNDADNVFLDSALAVAESIAKEAGEIMLRHFRTDVETVIKNNNTPITIADSAINSLVIQRIKEAYPEHAVIGEEESRDLPGASYVWVCDPIDGTIPYTLGMPTNVFALGLVEAKDGQPVLGVIFEPYGNRLYAAVRGKGATVNGKSIRVNDVSRLDNSIVACSGYLSNHVDYTEIKRQLSQQCWRQLITNCVMYEAMLVAEGRIAAALFPGTTEHDACAAAIIVQEAGGHASSIFGDPQRYDRPITGALFTNGVIDTLILEVTGTARLRL